MREMHSLVLDVGGGVDWVDWPSCEMHTSVLDVGGSAEFLEELAAVAVEGHRGGKGNQVELRIQGELGGVGGGGAQGTPGSRPPRCGRRWPSPRRRWRTWWWGRARGWAVGDKVERSFGRVTTADSAMGFEGCNKEVTVTHLATHVIPNSKKGEETQQKKGFSKGTDWEKKENK